MPCTVHARRADGRGDVVIGRGLTTDQAERVRDDTYRADHSITMIWALDSRGALIGEPLLREPPGLELP